LAICIRFAFDRQLAYANQGVIGGLIVAADQAHEELKKNKRRRGNALEQWQVAIVKPMCRSWQ
jgi:hypothetical protein